MREARLIQLLLCAGCAGCRLVALPSPSTAPAASAPAATGPTTPDERRHEFGAVHMGMPVHIVLYASTRAAAAAAAESAYARIAALENVFSDWRPYSELRALERPTGDGPGEWVRVSADLFAVLEQALDIARLTDGAYDPTIGPLVALWRETRATGVWPDDSAIAEARARVGWQHVELDSARFAVRLRRNGMRLDLGGIAKGKILQDALRTLRDVGVTRALIEAGGDIVVGDAPPALAGWRVAIPGTDSARAATLVNAALATSGPSAQFVEADGVRYSHVIDPRTGLGVTHGCTAHVIASKFAPNAPAAAAVADAVATALAVTGTAGLDRIRHAFPTVAITLRCS